MIPGFDLANFAQTAGPIAALLFVTGIVFAESGLLFGFFLPGDSVIFTLGFLVQGTGSVHLDLNIHLVVLCLFAAAVLGDNVGYGLGRKFGPKLFKRPNSLLFRQENIQKAQDFYEAHGSKTIIIARFIPIVRTFAPLVAGIGKMRYRTFMTFNLIGGAIWAAGVTYLGYFLGFYLRSAGIDVDSVLLPIIFLILFISVAPAAWHMLNTKTKRKNAVKYVKQFVQHILKKNKTD